MSITTIGLEELSRKVEDEVNKYAEQVTRSTAMEAWGEVKVATPVDTGAARNSWHIGYKDNEYYDESNGEKNPTSNLTMLTPKDKPHKIYVTNGTEYIESLNEGSSKQAPMKFVESVFTKYFDDVRVSYDKK